MSGLLGCDAVSLGPEASRPWKMTAPRSIETLGNNLRTQRDGPWDDRSAWGVYTVVQSVGTKPDGNWWNY